MANNLTSELNGLLADIHVLTIKLYNYHWNVGGIEFLSIHAKTEELYTYFNGVFDDLAERILQLGDKPISTLKGYLEATSIAEENAVSFEASEVMEKIHQDFTTVLAKAQSAAEQAGDDTVTADLLGDFVTILEKEIWMARSSLGK